MRYKKDPEQKQLFDPFKSVFSELGYRRIRSGWWEVFRRSILGLMPVDVLEQPFHEVMGRPTKELYSVAGLLLIKEFHDWTEEEAVDAYMFHAEIQYALNLDPAEQSMSRRTLQRYEKLFRDHELAQRVMNDVTAKLITELDLDVSLQRLDSTHFASNMATFGRTRLMGVTIKRFLTQLKRHDQASYESLPESLRERYAPSTGRLFAETSRTKEARSKLRQEVAEDLLSLIEAFADDQAHNKRQTYTVMVKVFHEQCEVVEDAIAVKAKTGGDVILNPSDPDASYDGKKGPGYQVQISETCSEANDQQLITTALVETASKSDQNALEPVLDELEQNGRLPSLLLADGGYGSDANVEHAESRCVDLQSPVAGQQSTEGNESSIAAYPLSVDDFSINEKTETVVRCPAGYEPVSSIHDAKRGVTTTIMPRSACAGCEYGGQCPIERKHGVFKLEHSAKRRRLDARRSEQATPEFRATYRKRAGGESVNSALKRRMGLGRLRVRGRRAVNHAIYLRIAGWNILRAAASLLWSTLLLKNRHSDSPRCSNLAPGKILTFSPLSPRHNLPTTLTRFAA